MLDFFFYEWYTFYSSALNGENHNYVNIKSQAFRLYKLECVKNSFCSKFSRKIKMAADDELTPLGVAVICIFIIFNALGLLGGFYAQVS